MKSKCLSAALLVLIMLLSLLQGGCSVQKKQRTKPLLSSLKDEDLRAELEELFVFVPKFEQTSGHIGVVEHDPLDMSEFRDNIRKMEIDIDYRATGEGKSYPIEETRRAVMLYYENELPAIRHYASRGKPRYEQTGVLLSEMEDPELLSTLAEHFFLRLIENSESTDLIRRFVKELEEDLEKDAYEIYPLEYGRTPSKGMYYSYSNYFIIEELRRAVDLYYGNGTETGSDTIPKVIDNKGEKLKLSQLDEETRNAVLKELGVLELFLTDEYSQVIVSQIASYENDPHGRLRFGYSTEERFLYAELYAAVRIYYSELYPFQTDPRA